MSWTQPICETCWPAFSIGLTAKRHEPTRVVDADRELCAFCGGETTSGIYVRANPEVVPHPRRECGR